MKRILFAALPILLAVGGSAYWYFSRPEVEINRTVDQIFDTLEHKKVSLSTPANPLESLRKVLADEVRVTGLPQTDSPVLTFEEICGKVSTLHNLTSLCEFQEQARWVAIEGNHAQASRTTTVTVAAGPRYRREETWELIFDLEKKDRWRINGIQAQKVD